MAERVRSIDVLTATLQLPKPIKVGGSEVSARTYTAVRLETTAGVVGESVGLTRTRPVAEHLVDVLAPTLIGVEVAVLMDDPTALEAAGSEVSTYAFGLLNAAAWDARAIAADVPLWRQLRPPTASDPLGGPDVMAIPAYPDRSESPREIANRLVREGGRHPLIKLAGDPDPERMREILAATRPLLGDSSALVVDVAGSWSSASAAVNAIEIWECDWLAWLEDPFPPDAIDCYRGLRSATGMRIGAGDEVADPIVYGRLLDLDVLDVVRVDALAFGGVDRVRALQRRATDARLAVSFHVNPHLSTHLAISGGGSIELFDGSPKRPNPVEPGHLLLRERVTMQRGRALLPRVAGTGAHIEPWRFTLVGRAGEPM